MSKPDWKDAPEWANWLAMDGDGEWFWYESVPRVSSGDSWACEHAGAKYSYSGCNGGGIDWRESRELRPTKVNITATGKGMPNDAVPSSITNAGEINKYQREIVPGVYVDVYDVLHAFAVTNPATAHAIKKLLAPGQRGHKDMLQDLQEAADSIQRAIELEYYKK